MTEPPRRRRPRPEPQYEFEDAYVDPDDDYVPVRIDSPVGRRVLYGVLTVVLAFAIVAGFGLVWAMRQIDPPGEQGDPVAAIEVPRGASLDSIAQLLEEHDVISSASVFGWYAKIRGIGGEWRAGTYDKFRENSSMSEASRVLAEGPVPPDDLSLQIPPGMRVVDALARIAETFPEVSVESLSSALASGAITSKYLPPEMALEPDVNRRWEGMLAPDTYRFEKTATAEKILQTLADQQVKVLDDLGYGRAEALAGRTAYDLIKMASLIEREAGDPDDEKPKIARVINNRLDANEPLGIDATILYGLGKRAGDLTGSDLKTDTPYNSRIHAGLPPTPISLVSEASLKAAIEPAEGPWKWYVLTSRNPATHFFTDDYQEFLRAKKQAEADGIF